MEAIKNFFKKVKVNSILIAFASIVVGIILLAIPNEAVKISCILLGVVLGILAVVEFIGVFSAGIGSDYSIAKAVGYTVIAAWLFSFPVSVVGAVLNIVFAVLIIVSGAEQMQMSVQLYKRKMSDWWVMLVLGVITVALGIAVFFIKEAVFTYLGISLLIDGFVILVKVIVYDRRIRKIKKELEKAMKAEQQAK